MKKRKKKLTDKQLKALAEGRKKRLEKYKNKSKKTNK